MSLDKFNDDGYRMDEKRSRAGEDCQLEASRSQSARKRAKRCVIAAEDRHEGPVWRPVDNSPTSRPSSDNGRFPSVRLLREFRFHPPEEEVRVVKIGVKTESLDYKLRNVRTKRNRRKNFRNILYF